MHQCSWLNQEILCFLLPPCGLEFSFFLFFLFWNLSEPFSFQKYTLKVWRCLNVLIKQSTFWPHFQITVIFKTYQGCTEQKVYQATTEDLPLAFQDGTRSGGESSSLTIMERGGSSGVGRQVKIQARYIGTSIIIRRVGSYLTFAIRMPEDTLDFSEDSGGLQLCLHGCPRNELIKEHTLSRQSQQPRLQATNTELGPLRPPHQVYTVERATAKCRETLQVEDLYFQSCVFDLLTTGDPEFSMAAYGALEDLKALPPSKLKQNSPRTPRVLNGGATQTLAATSNGSLLPLLLLTVLLL